MHTNRFAQFPRPRLNNRFSCDLVGKLRMSQSENSPIPHFTNRSSIQINFSSDIPSYLPESSLNRNRIVLFSSFTSCMKNAYEDKTTRGEKIQNILFASICEQIFEFRKKKISSQMT